MVFSIGISYSQRYLTVTKTTDPDPFEHPFNAVDSLCDPDMYGTLQWAIRKANSSFDSSLVVNFNIPGSGMKEIALNYELPMIVNNTVPIFIDGTSQQGYSYGGPTIEINGQSLIGTCFQTYKTNISIKGFSIKNFLYHGIVVNTPSGTSEINQNVINNIENGENNTAAIGIRVIFTNTLGVFNIIGNHIGTGISTTNIEDYGILIDYCDGINIGGTLDNQSNTITNCGIRGIYLSGSNHVRMSANLIYNNPIAIWSLGSNDNKQAPAITLFQNDTLYGTSAPNDIIEVFGSNGDQQVNEFIGSAITDDNGNWFLPIQTTYNFVAVNATDTEGNSSIFAYLDIVTYNCTLDFYCYQHSVCAPGSVQLSALCTGGQTVCQGQGQDCYYNLYDQTEGIFLASDMYNGYCNGIYSNTYFPSTIQHCNMYHTIVLYLSCFTFNIDDGSPVAYLQVWVGCPPSTSSIISSEPDNTICSGQNVTLTCNSPYSTDWSWSTGAITQSITVHPSVTTTYYVTPYNGCGNGPVAQITIYVNPSPQVTIQGTTPLCYSYADILTAITQPECSNCTYTWSPTDNITSNNGSYITIQSPLDNPNETFNVIVTNSYGCTGTASFTVHELPQLYITPHNGSVYCYGWSGCVSIDVSGGNPPYAYSWLNGNMTNQNCNVSPGTYTVTVNDANNCSYTSTVTLSQPPQLHASITNYTNVKCNGGSDGTATVSASGGTPGYTYHWSDGENTQTATNLSASTYTVTVYDTHNCTTTATVTINQPAPMTINTDVGNVLCNGDNSGSIIITSVTNGTPPYLYHWPDGTTTTTNSIHNLPAGTYQVTVTDANNCSIVVPVIITQPSALTVQNLNYTPSICQNSQNGSISVSATGGTPSYQYSISNQSNNNGNFTGLSVGNYFITITDQNGCTTTAHISINPKPDPVAAFTQTSCAYLGGPTSFTNTSLNATSFIWDFGDETTSTATNPQHIYSSANNNYGVYCVTLTAINDCGISKYTQSIYEEPAKCVCNTIFTYQNYVVSPYTTFSISGQVTIKGDFTVETGATLNISTQSILRFAPDGRIIVKRGAHLNISDNVTLTSLGGTCDYMWQGIEVWGYPTLLSSDYQQGILKMGNTVKIENAHIAVLLGARKDNVCGRHIANINWAFDNNMAGGVIQMNARDNFINNGIDIKFLPKNSASNDGSNNIIYDAAFSCTPPLIDAHYNSSNQNPYPNLHNPWAGSANSDQRSYIGIQSTNISKLIINNCRMSNHEYGIYTLDNQKTTVTGCIFTNMRRGMRIENSTPTLLSGYDITSCSFNYIPGNTSGTLAAYDGTAIYINNGMGYKIHDGNQFNNTYSTNMNTYKPFGIITYFASSVQITNNIFSQLYKGIIINNSGTYGSTIMAKASSWIGNVFYNCSTGIMTINTNSNLCIRCNTHNSNNVINPIAWNTISGTLANQGLTGWQPIDNVNNSRFGAGNYFYPVATPTQNYLISAPTIAYNYIYHIAPAQYVPYVYSPITKTPMTNVSFHGNTTSCPLPNIVPPTISLTTSTPLNAPVFLRIDSLNNVVSTLQVQYQVLVNNADKGHTQDLLNAINATPPTGQLKNMLVSDSPLSDTVLIVLNTQFPLSNGNYKNVMDENLPVDRKVAPSFYNRVGTLPNGIKNQLLSEQANNPGKTTLGSVEQQLDQAKQIKALYFSSVISALLDSTVNRKADAITLLEREGTPEANLILASTYMSDSNYTAAASKIAQLPDDNGAYSDWKAYATMLLTHFEQGKTLEELDSNQIAYIRTLAYQCPDEMATANAKAVLFYLLRETVPPCPLNETRIQQLQNKPDNNQSSFLGENYPDPFTNRTVIPYYLPKGLEGELTVKDVTGRMLYTAPLQEGENRLEIDTRNWAAGIYVYGMTINGEIVEARKMVKSE